MDITTCQTVSSKKPQQVVVVSQTRSQKRRPVLRCTELYSVTSTEDTWFPAGGFSPCNRFFLLILRFLFFKVMCLSIITILAPDKKSRATTTILRHTLLWDRCRRTQCRVDPYKSASDLLNWMEIACFEIFVWPIYIVKMQRSRSPKAMLTQLPWWQIVNILYMWMCSVILSPGPHRVAHL